MRNCAENLTHVLVVRRHDERFQRIFAAQFTQDIGVLSQAEVFFGPWGEGARGQRLAVAVQANIGHGGINNKITVAMLWLCLNP